jgi:YfiH family protein
LAQGDFRLISQGGTAWLECASLARFSWLVHAFGTRLAGHGPASASGLDTGATGLGEPRNAPTGRGSLPGVPGAAGFSVASLQQVHSATIYRVSRAGGGLRYQALPPISNAPSVAASGASLAGAGPFCGDAMITGQPGILLSIRTADCLPILLVDARHGAVAAIHCGWRGALAGIVENSVVEMRRAFESRPEELLAAMGPSIRACCYEVGDEVVSAFRERFASVEGLFRIVSEAALPLDQPPREATSAAETASARRSRNAARRHLDLVAAARHQLLAAGLQAPNLFVADYCTACRPDLFFSYRREGNSTGRMSALIGISN